MTSSRTASKSALPAWKLLLLALLCTFIGFSIVIGMLAITFPSLLTRELVLFLLCVCAPLSLLYLWTHRAPDNKSFIIK